MNVLIHTPLTFMPCLKVASILSVVFHTSYLLSGSVSGFAVPSPHLHAVLRAPKLVVLALERFKIK